MPDKEQITAVVARLRSVHVADRQERVGDALLRWIEDRLKPKTDMGNLRINPILVLLMVIAVLTVSTFLLFSLVQL